MQFSLRTLLLLVTLMSVWLGREVERARRQKQIADAVRSGADARWDSGGLVRYRSQQPKASLAPLHDWIARVLGRDLVEAIDYVCLRPCYSAQLPSRIGQVPRGLEELTGLRYLDVQGTDFDDEYLTRIRSLHKLVSLNVRDTKVSDSAVAAFQSAVPGCRVIH